MSETLLVRDHIPRKNATYHITPKVAKMVSRLAKSHASTRGKIIESAVILLEKTLTHNGNGTQESDFNGDRRIN